MAHPFRQTYPYSRAILVFDRSGFWQSSAQRAAIPCERETPLASLALPAPLPMPVPVPMPIPAEEAAPIPASGNASDPAVGEGRPRVSTVVYRVNCSDRFRAAVIALAERRGVEIPALIASILAVVEPAVYGAIPDPGDGRGEGFGARAVLLLHLPPGLDHRIIRQILATSLALAGPGAYRLIAGPELDRLRGTIEKLEYRNKALARAVERLSFEPLGDESAMTLRDAVCILGLGEECYFDEQLITRRFRELAMIYHPDTGLVPSRQRMAQLIEARNLLVHHVRRPRSGGIPL